MDQSGSRNVDKVLVDVSVLLADSDVLLRIGNKGGFAFVGSATLDAVKSTAETFGSSRSNAQELLTRLQTSRSVRLKTLPTGEALQGQDSLTRLAYVGGPVYLIERPLFRSRLDSGVGLIELALDYGMIFLISSSALKAKAEAAGVQVSAWRGPRSARPLVPPQTQQTGRTRPPAEMRPNGAMGVRPFAVCQQPVSQPEVVVSVSNLPTTGDSIRFSGAAARLGRQISAGGEGIIYEVESRDQVCKVYHPEKLTQLKKQKIELMVSRRIERPGICWPTDVATNTAGEFVGYLMPRAYGQTMQSAMFVKPKLEKTFPNWCRLDLVNVAGTFLDHVDFLHSHNIIIGDINPMNLLVTPDSTAVWIVDTDSFQIEAFPCPVGTVNFTPAEIQGLNYSGFLRTVEHELFAVATMIFMILFPGKAPYSQQGGGSPADNIKSRNFPYRFAKQSGRATPDVSGEDAPPGPWQFIWSHLPLQFREAFHATFKENRRVMVKTWADLLRNYRWRLENGRAVNELFPLHFWVSDPVELTCGNCSRSFTNSRKFAEKLALKGQEAWCPQCRHRKKLEWLARDSHRATQEVTSAPLPAARPVYRSTGQKPVIPAPIPRGRTTPHVAAPPLHRAPAPRPTTAKTSQRQTSALADIWSLVNHLFRK